MLFQISHFKHYVHFIVFDIIAFLKSSAVRSSSSSVSAFYRLLWLLFLFFNSLSFFSLLFLVLSDFCCIDYRRDYAKCRYYHNFHIRDSTNLLLFFRPNCQVFLDCLLRSSSNCSSSGKFSFTYHMLSVSYLFSIVISFSTVSASTFSLFSSSISSDRYSFLLMFLHIFDLLFLLTPLFHICV